METLDTVLYNYLPCECMISPCPFAACPYGFSMLICLVCPLAAPWILESNVDTLLYNYLLCGCMDSPGARAAVCPLNDVRGSLR